MDYRILPGLLQGGTGKTCCKLIRWCMRCMGAKAEVLRPYNATNSFPIDVYERSSILHPAPSDHPFDYYTMADNSNVRQLWELPDHINQDTSCTESSTHNDLQVLPERPMSKKDKKKKKKKEGLIAREAVTQLGEIAQPSLENDQNIPTEEAPVEAPSHMPKEPDSPVYIQEQSIEKVQTPSEDGVGKMFNSSQANDAPSPIYLTFNAQHRLMVFLQQKLEEMCFAVCQQRMPQTLIERGWDCPESAELQNWVAILKTELPATVQFKARISLLSSMSKIRDCAVNRIHVDHIQLENLLSDALKLAKLLEQDQYAKTIERLHEDAENTFRYLEEETKQIQQSFNFKLDQIAAARAKLDDLEKATKTALDKSLLTRQNKARGMILQSIQNVEGLEQRLDPEDRSVTMSSLDLVNDLENSLMLDEDGGRLF